VADHSALAAVSRSLRALLQDRLVEPATITFAPPDITVEGVAGPRINLYLIQVVESATLRNQDLPERAHPGEYGRPPLTLTLRYMMTTHSALETQPDADLNAQRLFGDAMRVLHEFGPQLSTIIASTGSPVRLIDPALQQERDQVKVTLHPAGLDDLTKIWSASGESPFRRTAFYDVDIVRIVTPEQRVRPRPVEERRIMAVVRRRPQIIDAYVTPAAGERPTERRVRVGDEITIEAANVSAARLYVRIGTLKPIRVTLTGDGLIRLAVPDDAYPIDLDHPATRPIPPAEQLQPGAIHVVLVAVQPAESVAGGLGPGARIEEDRAFYSDAALLQLVPGVTGVTPASGGPGTIVRVTGTRLWHARARAAEVMIGDAGIPIRSPPNPGDWASPSPTQVEVPFDDALAFAPVQAAGEPAYALAVQVDGARSRDAVGFARTS
jgi:hypothetical protein